MGQKFIFHLKHLTMSEGKTTLDKPKKKTSRTSSGTLYTREISRSPGRPTRSTAEKDRVKEQEEQNSTEPELSEEDEVYAKGGGNESSEEAEKHHQIVDQRDTSRNNPSVKSNEKPLTSNKSSISPLHVLGILGLLVLVYIFSSGNSTTYPCGEDWRSQIDPNDHLSTKQRSVISASLKPICDKSSADQDEGVSTLLILSSDEEVPAKLARCLLGKVNKPTNDDQISAEIDLKSHYGGKLALDSKLKRLLNTTDPRRAVLLRRIDDIPSNDMLNQLRLLFAYCDGENPVIPHRLIIMTATSSSKTEKDLREQFQIRLPDEYDFIDALMSRISGHTLYLEKDQKSIC